MTKLGDFINRHGARKVALVVGGLAAAEIAMFAMAAPAAVYALSPPPKAKVHVVALDTTGQALVKAVETRLEDQFMDLKRIVSAVDSIADSPVSGADKMRAVTLAARQLAALTPDDGAKAYDGVYFASPAAEGDSRFAGVHRTLNEDKRDLANAAMRLGRIQNALLTGDEEELASEMIELEGAVARYEARRLESPVVSVVADGDPLSVTVEEVKSFFEMERQRQYVEIDRPKIRVEVAR